MSLPMICHPHTPMCHHPPLDVTPWLVTPLPTDVSTPVLAAAKCLAFGTKSSSILCCWPVTSKKWKHMELGGGQFPCIRTSLDTHSAGSFSKRWEWAAEQKCPECRESGNELKSCCLSSNTELSEHLFLLPICNRNAFIRFPLVNDDMCT